MGLTEILLVGAVALMLFTPRELPSIIKGIARFYASLRRTAEDFRAQIMESEEMQDIRGEYHRTRAEIDRAKHMARREVQKVQREAKSVGDSVKQTAQEGKSALSGRVGQGEPAERSKVAPTESERRLKVAAAGDDDDGRDQGAA